MEETTKAGVVSSLQMIEDELGVDGVISSAVSGWAEGNEEEEGAPEEIELDTGVTIAVISDEDIEESVEDNCKTSCRKCLIVLAALLILPTVNISVLILQFAVNSMETELEAGTTPMTNWMLTTTWSTPSVHHCEFNPSTPECQAWYEKMTWPTAVTTTQAGAGDLCAEYPWLDQCQVRRRRKKRSRPVSDPSTSTAYYGSVGETHRKIITGDAFSGPGHEAFLVRFKAVEPGSDSGVEESRHVIRPTPAVKSEKMPDVRRSLINQASQLRAITASDLGRLLPPSSPRKNNLAKGVLWSARDETAKTLNDIFKSARTVGPWDDDTGVIDRPHLSEWTKLSAATGTVGGKIVRRQKRAQDDGSYEDFGSEQPYGPATAAVPEFQAVQDTHEVVYGLFGIISGILITAFNYRVTALAGACISGFGCLVASFIPLNSPAMAFLLGAVLGIGNNFLVTSATVALLECFREHRLRLISVTNASVLLGIIAYFLVHLFLFPKMGIDGGDWRALLQYQAVTYAICIGGAAALVPLNLHMRDSPSDTVRGRMLGISGLKMLKSPILYAMAAIFLFNSLGGDIPKAFIGKATSGSFISKLLAIFIVIGAFVGSLVGCCMSWRKMTLVVSLVLIACYGVVMGSLTLAVEAFGVIEYAVTYCFLFGLLSGMRLPLMTHIIPLALGEDHLGLSVGLTSFASGLGSIIGPESAGAIVENYKDVDAVFYLSGLALLVSAAASVVLIKLKARLASQTSATDDGEAVKSVADGAKEDEAKGGVANETAT